MSVCDEDSLIMANIRPLMAIAFLVTLGSEAAIAMPPQEIPAEVKSCKAIVDDKERLKCFDGLFGETSKPEEFGGRKASQLVNRGNQIAN